MTPTLQAAPLATVPVAALISLRREAERRCAQAAAVRYAQELAARNARDSRNYRGLIDSPLFANV